MNKVILHGTISGQPMSRSTGSGKRVCNLRISTPPSPGRKYADVHRCVAWEEMADRCDPLTEGTAVQAEGHLSYGSYEKDGVKHYTTDVTIDRIQVERNSATVAPRSTPRAAPPTQDDDGSPF